MARIENDRLAFEKGYAVDSARFQPDPTKSGNGYDLIDQILQKRSLIIASNRGPISFKKDENGELEPKRGGGGLVTALTGLANLTEAHWIACAQTEEDRNWGSGPVPLDSGGKSIEYDHSLYVQGLTN